MLKYMELSSYTPLGAQELELDGGAAHQMAEEAQQARSEASQPPDLPSGLESQQHQAAAQQQSMVSLLVNDAGAASLSNVQVATAAPGAMTRHQDLRLSMPANTSSLPQMPSGSLLEQEIVRQLGGRLGVQRSDLLGLLQSLVTQETQRNDAISVNLALHNLLREAAHSDVLSQLLQPPTLPPLVAAQRFHLQESLKNPSDA